MFRLLFITIVFVFLALPAHAENTRDMSAKIPEAFRVTGFALPRFASLQSKEVYVRSGPGLKYPIKWVYKKSGLPVEIILEFEVWRKVRDYEGQEGWVHSTLLSGVRSGIIQDFKESSENTVTNKKNVDPQPIPVYQKPRQNAKRAAKIMPGAIVKLDECFTGWCLIAAEGYKGWVERKFIWGVYKDESFK